MRYAALFGESICGPGPMRKCSLPGRGYRIRRPRAIRIQSCAGYAMIRMNADRQ